MDFEKIRIKPVWPKSKEEIWSEKFELLVSQGESRKANQILFRKTDAAHLGAPGKKKRFPLWGYAASILIPVLLFCNIYTVTESTKRGEQAVVQLPDRSTVTLNAESKLSYKPFIWFISRKAANSSTSRSRMFARKVSLEGEAYFEVTQGNRFSVQTGNNRVNVLGTTFNVLARPGLYRITCLTGQVEVQAGHETAILSQKMQATLRERKLNINSDVTTTVATGWIQGMFVFEGAQLEEVIAEIERRYNINVTPNYDANLLYTGIFSKTDNPEEVLEAVGKAFDIIFSIK